MKAELKDKVMTWENISKKKTNALIPFFKKLDIDYSPAFDGGDYIEECLEKVSVKIAELKKENAELKKENEKVKEYNNNEEWDELMEFTSTLSGSPAEPEDIKDYINGVNGMVGELKEEIEELKETIKDKNACLLSWGEQEKKLKAILYEGDNEK